MSLVRSLFWRAITPADYFNIERNHENGPQGGGGQSYISISFAGLSHEDFGRFLGLHPASRIASERPPIPLRDVKVAVDPRQSGDLMLRSRYRPPNPDDRYRIATQNRQFQTRHPAWSAALGFPKAPDDVEQGDPRLTDLTYLKIFILKLNDDSYRAGFVNSPHPTGPLAAFPEARVLFAPFSESQSAGIIHFEDSPLDASAFVDSDAAWSFVDDVEAPEVAAVAEETKRMAGRRGSGQGRQMNVASKIATELRAMEVARDSLAREGYRVEDVSFNRPYDLYCLRRGRELLVEVKGTTGDGSAVLLTPGEVHHARENADRVALYIVSGIRTEYDPVTDTALATGGELRIILPWDISAGTLSPTGYEYRV